MPIIEIKILRGTLTEDEKHQLVERVGEAAIAVEGEARRPFLTVGLTELAPPAIVGGRVVPRKP